MGPLKFSKGTVAHPIKDNPINFSSMGIGAHNRSISRLVSRNVFTINNGNSFDVNVTPIISPSLYSVALDAPSLSILININKRPDSEVSRVTIRSTTSKVTIGTPQLIFGDVGDQPIQLVINGPVSGTQILADAEEGGRAVATLISLPDIDTASISAADGSNLATPTITGTRANGDIIELYEGSTIIGTDTGSGTTWSITTLALSHGSHTIVAKAIDSRGNKSDGSVAQTFTLDLVDPYITSIAVVSDNSTPTLANATNILTFTVGFSEAVTLSSSDDVKVPFTIGEEGGTTQYAVANATTSRTINSIANAVEFTYAVPTGANGVVKLVAGLLTIEPGETVLDSATNPLAGGMPALDENNIVTVDTIAPVPPDNITFTTPTNVTRPVISGNKPEGTTVKVNATKDSSTLEIGAYNVTSATTWSITSSQTLSEGTWSITTTATDPAGNTSAESVPRSIVIDTTPPTILIANGISVATDNTTDPTKAVLNDNIIFTVTFSEAVTLSSPANVKVPFTIAGTTGYEAVAQTATSGTINGSANAVQFTYSVASPGIDGAIGLSANTPLTIETGASVRDAANNDLTGIMPLLSSPTVTVDTPPTAPTIDEITTESQTTTPTITGTRMSGTTIELFEGGNSIGTDNNTSSGTWSIKTFALAIGTTYSLTAKATDSTNNVSADSATQALVIASGVPYDITLDTPLNDNTPIISGKGVDGTNITLLVDGTPTDYTGIVSSGAWSITHAIALADKTYSITATATDAAGNTSAASTGLDIDIDTTAPAVPSNITFTTPTNDTTPDISGDRAEGSTIKVYANGNLIGTDSGTGTTWSITSSELTAGTTYSITATATDAAGNTSAASTGLDIDIDTTAPAAPVITEITTASQTTTPTIEGTRELGTTIELFEGNNTTPIGTDLDTTSGTWSITTSPLNVSTTYTLTAKATDAAGNVSSVSASQDITIAPAAPGINAITTPIANTTPEITGSGVDGDTITLLIDGNPTTYTTTVASSAWSITPSSALTAGTTYNISATATDPAGNTSAASTAQSLTIVVSIETIYVSAGDQTQEPYYTFTTDSGTWNGTVYLDTAYTFARLNDVTSHPFYVSDNTVSSSTSDITITGDGGPSDGIEGTETLTVAFTGLATGDSFFGYCTAHPSTMVVNFTIEASASA